MGGTAATHVPQIVRIVVACAFVGDYRVEGAPRKYQSAAFGITCYTRLLTITKHYKKIRRITEKYTVLLKNTLYYGKIQNF